MTDRLTQVRDLSPDRLLAQCRWEAFRGSGPGGQKRNKTSSAVRITHVPTGLAALAGESRSQAENRRKALERLRHRIALEVRLPVNLDPFAMPSWSIELLTNPGQALRLTSLSRRHERYLDLVGLLLDLLAALGGSVSAAAALVGTTSSDLVGFLQRDEKLFAAVNHLRKKRGFKALGSE